MVDDDFIRRFSISRTLRPVSMAVELATARTICAFVIVWFFCGFMSTSSYMDGFILTQTLSSAMLFTFFVAYRLTFVARFLSSNNRTRNSLYVVSEEGELTQTATHKDSLWVRCDGFVTCTIPSSNLITTRRTPNRRTSGLAGAISIKISKRRR